MADAGYLTIGKVVKRLQEQYPDLSVSKVRYLEDEGLLNPSRTPGGYRLYSQHDVHRLEMILHLQKTRFMPLSVIKEELDRGVTGEGVGAAAGPAAPAARTVEPVAPLPQMDDPETVSKLHPIENMPELLGVTVGFVQQLAEVGVIGLQRSPHGRDLVDGRDFALIRVCDSLRHYGFGPKNLRQYVQAARRESGMLEQALVPYAHRGGASGQVSDETRAQFAQAFAEMVTLTDQVRDALIRRQISQSFKGMDLDAGASGAAYR